MERLALLVELGNRFAGMAGSLRCEGNRVTGCVSRVWVRGWLEESRLRLEVDSETGMVRGLVGLLAWFYDDSEVEEVKSVEPLFFEKLNVIGQLSPTRSNGLLSVRERIRRLAEGEGIEDRRIG